MKILDKSVKELLKGIELNTELNYQDQLRENVKAGNDVFKHFKFNEYLADNCFLHEKAICAAIFANDLEAVKELTTLFNVDVNNPLTMGGGLCYSPLSLAIDSKNIQILKLLLEQGANIFAEYNNSSPFKYLLEHYNPGDLFYLSTWQEIDQHLIKNGEKSLIDKFNIQRDEYRIAKSFYQHNDLKVAWESSVDEINTNNSQPCFDNQDTMCLGNTIHKLCNLIQ